MTEIFKRYIELSNAFRKSNGSTQSVENLYDLLYELDGKQRNKEEDFILCNVYFLLGFYLSAYEIFREIADLSNPKDASKLYVWKEKSQTHANKFIIKDLRKFSKKQAQKSFQISDFKLIKENMYQLEKGEVIIFNQSLSKDKFKIFTAENLSLEACFDNISDYLNWLSDAKNELIDFYNHQLSPHTDEQADDNWYYALEVYSARIIIDNQGNISAEIATGDTITPDHILDIELENKTVVSMNFDG